MTDKYLKDGARGETFYEYENPPINILKPKDETMKTEIVKSSIIKYDGSWDVSITPTNEEAKKKALIINASDELLEACKEAITKLRHIRNKSTRFPYRDTGEVMMDLQDAINKAEGKNETI